MTYSKEYYKKNRERILEQTKEWNKKHREQINKTRKDWRKGIGKEKNRISKQKSDNKYHAKMKSDPEYLQKRREYMTKYNAEHREHQKIMMGKHRAKPEIKKKNAEYNKKFHQENPDLLLKNTRAYLTRFGKFHNMKWIEIHDQLRGWSKIIHEDYANKCAVCGKPSKEAHHIFHKSKYPELAFNRNNGIALCTLCHNQAHAKMLV